MKRRRKKSRTHFFLYVLHFYTLLSSRVSPPPHTLGSERTLNALHKHNHIIKPEIYVTIYTYTPVHTVHTVAPSLSFISLSLPAYALVRRCLHLMCSDFKPFYFFHIAFLPFTFLYVDCWVLRSFLFSFLFILYTLLLLFLYLFGGFGVCVRACAEIITCCCCWLWTLNAGNVIFEMDTKCAMNKIEQNAFRRSTDQGSRKRERERKHKKLRRKKEEFVCERQFNCANVCMRVWLRRLRLFCCLTVSFSFVLYTNAMQATFVPSITFS